MFDRQLVVTSGRTHTIDRSSKRLPSLFIDHQNNQQSLELRDLVKDSMYREVQSLSTKSEHIERRELLRSLSYHHSKDGSSSSIPSDAPPRFSYDGREVNRSSYESSSNGLKPSFPRLSLDSRENSTLSLNADLKSSFMLKKDGNKLDEKSQNVRETQGNQKRLPSVVARLMGLEALPDYSSLRETNVGDHVKITKSSEKSGSNEPSHLSAAKNLWKEPSSPRSIKPLARFPLEPAPWKQIEKARLHKKSGSMKSPALSPSVYSEIDKRLKELEFLESGKDLRALKQIMDAMHVKGLVETLEEGQGSNFSSSSGITDQVISFTTKKNFSPSTNQESPIVIMKPVKLLEKSSIPAALVFQLDGSSCPTKLKARDLTHKSNSSSGRKVKNPNFDSGERGVSSVDMKNGKNTKTTLASASKRQQNLSKEGNGVFGKKISGSTSPRTQQKKLDMEKRSRPPTPPSSVKSKVIQSNKRQADPKSSGVRRRASKNPNLQGCDDQLSESSVASSSSSYYTEIEDSAQSSDIVSHWPQDSEASSSRRSSLTSVEASESLVTKKSNSMMREEDSAEQGFVPHDHLSPVSVLENINEHKGGSPYPKKHVRKIPQDESVFKEGDSSIDQQGSEKSFVSIGINRKKLENIDNLVQKLRRVNSNHDEAHVDYIASLCDNTDPDHRYVSEILLASGLLLRDFSSNSTDILQFHPSGYPLNPELFLVLEQTKASTRPNRERLSLNKTQLTKNEKFHRKLIFDTVNEILVTKLPFSYPNSDPCPRTFKLARFPLNAQKLLRELCSEIEGLQNKNSNCSFSEEDEAWKTILSEDVMNRSESWINFHVEISGIVLHIERLIFKDLVKEIVLGEIDGVKANRTRRKLFAK